MKNINNYCIIMGGGAGTRFWPISRSSMPKQFIDPLGTGITLIQQTFDRFKKIVPTENIFIVTNEAYKHIVSEQLPDLSDSQILLEPARRNTAPCIAWASYHIHTLNPEANIVVAPSDHIILKEAEFVEAIEKGLDFVDKTDKLLTLGIKPNRPETAYGYIQIKEKIKDNFYEVKTFTEKPELEIARMFIETGEFYWNSGLFIWSTKTIIEEIKDKLPDIHSTLYRNNEHIYCTDKEQEFIKNNFELCPSVSIDYGVMEKTNKAYVQLCDFGWSDLGTWHSLYEISTKDNEENVITNNNAKIYNGKGNIVVMPKGKIAVIDGLDDYLVAESNDVLIICKKDEESQIRKFVNDTKEIFGEKYI